MLLNTMVQSIYLFKLALYYTIIKYFGSLIVRHCHCQVDVLPGLPARPWFYSMKYVPAIFRRPTGNTNNYPARESKAMEKQRSNKQWKTVDITTSDITVVEYLNKIGDQYVEQLTKHGQERIAAFRKEAADVRATIAQYQ